MKIALCLSGLTGKVQSRKGGGSYGADIHPKLGYQSWKSSLIDFYDVDVFIHSWDEKYKDILENFYNPVLSHFEPQKKWSPKTADWLTEYNHPLLTLDDLLEDKRYANLPDAFGDSVWDDLRYASKRSLSRWYGNQQAVQLKKNYEKTNNFKYDFVIMGRFDLWFEQRFNLENLDSNYFYASPRTNGTELRKDHEYALQDLFFLGNSCLMDEFYKLYDNVFDYCISSPMAAFEHAHKFLGSEKIKYLSWGFLKEYNILRWKFPPNMIPTIGDK